MAFLVNAGKLRPGRTVRGGSCHCSRSPSQLPTFAEVVEKSPVEILDKSGPLILRIEARNGDGELAGYVNAYRVPGTMSANCDAFQVKKEQAGRGLVEMNTGRWVWMAFLAALCERKIEVCYGLAIEDEPRQHRRLVKYFRRMGAAPVRKVANRVKDVGDRLVWGGAGLIMEVQVKSLLTRWWKVVQ